MSIAEELEEVEAAATPFSLAGALGAEMSVVNSTPIVPTSVAASVSPAFESDASALAEIMGKKPETRETKVSCALGRCV